MRRTISTAAAVAALVIPLAACSADGGDGGLAGDRVEIVITTAPGGLTDTTGRALAACLEDELDKTVIPKNVDGASGALGIRELINAEPDGTTLVVTPSTGITLSPQMDDLGFSLDNVTPMALVAQVGDILVAREGAPATNGEDFVTYLQENSSVNVGTPGPTSPKTLAVSILKEKGLDAKAVPLGSNDPEVITALLGGTVEFGALSATDPTKEQIKAGKVIPLVALTAERIEGIDAPTLSELGVDLELPAMYMAVLAPPELDSEAKEILAPAMETCAASDAMTTAVGEDYLVPDYMQPDAVQEALAADAQLYGTLVD